MAKKKSGSPPARPGRKSLTADGIDVIAPAQTTTAQTGVQVNCSCGGTMTPVIITVTEQRPSGPPIAYAITPLDFHCGDTIQVSTPMVGTYYTVTATMRCDDVAYSDSATIERQ